MSLENREGMRSGDQVANWSCRFAKLVERAQVLQSADFLSDADIVTHQLGAVQLVRLRCGESRIERTQNDIGRDAEPCFTFMLIVQGNAAVSHCGNHLRLGEGDLTLLSSKAPYSTSTEEASELILLRVPAATARGYMPTPDHFCGRRLDADKGLASTAAAMAKSLALQLDRELSPECREQAGRHLLAITASTFVATFDDLITASSIMAGRHLKVKLHIEQHLRDPELSPSLIAKRLRLSSRYLRMIFAAGSESPSAFILRRRLEECARQLADPRWRGHSITEIAFSWGFNSAPHFTRSFRERFAVPPRDFRQQQIARGTVPSLAASLRPARHVSAVAA